MTNRSLLPRIPGLLLLGASLALATPAAFAAGPEGGATTVTTTDADAAADKDGDTSRWSGSITAETSVGLGTFVSGDQNNPFVVTAFTPRIKYKLADNIRLGAQFALSWYNKPDFTTPLEEGKVLMSDISLSISHASVWKHEDSGFNIAGAFSIGLPTSLSSQFQNRLFSLKPSLSASIPVGPVTFRYTFGFMKYFASSATPSVDCDQFDNPEQCREGRDESGGNFGFESERRGGEVFVANSGVSSYYFQNGLSVSWQIIEDLSLAAGVTIYNVFGVRSFDEDELANVNARAGRSQTDRLISSLGLSYQVIKQLAVGLDFVTDTTRPFGANDDSLVVYNFSRASDNISSISLSVTGSL